MGVCAVTVSHATKGRQANKCPEPAEMFGSPLRQLVRRINVFSICSTDILAFDAFLFWYFILNARNTTQRNVSRVFCSKHLSDMSVIYLNKQG